MDGTNFDATLAILLIPPKITIETKKETLIPVNIFPVNIFDSNNPRGWYIKSLIIWDNWLAWKKVIHPNAPEILNINARGRNFSPRPFSIKYITPPCISPWSSLPRYIKANEQVKNFVLIPNIAVIHIQNIAPGPPEWIATATPAMFPIPTVLANALDNASKCVIWPGSSLESYFPSKISIACLKYIKGVSRQYIEKNMPPPNKRITSGVPHNNPANFDMILSTTS